MAPSLKATLVMLVGLVIAGCSSDPDAEPKRPAPTVMTAASMSCDRDRTSIDAKSTIERVGGLVTDDYVVRFAQSTKLGVIALITGDSDKAYADLTGTYDVAVVAPIDDDGTDRVTGFQQVRDLVASLCK